MSQIVKGNHIPEERKSYTLDQLWLMSSLGALQHIEEYMASAYNPKRTGLPVDCDVGTEIEIRQLWDNLRYDLNVVYKFIEEVQGRFISED